MGVSRRRTIDVFRILGLVVGLASAAPGYSLPNESPILTINTTDLNGGAVDFPGPPGSRRIVVLLGFSHDHQAALDAWKQGLGLTDSQGGWLEMPVIGVGAAPIKAMILGGMRRRFSTVEARAHMAPAFTNAADLARRLRLDPHQPAALVVGPTGQVFAAVSGGYAPAKAASVTRALAGL